MGRLMKEASSGRTGEREDQVRLGMLLRGAGCWVPCSGCIPGGECCVCRVRTYVQTGFDARRKVRWIAAASSLFGARCSVFGARCLVRAV